MKMGQRWGLGSSLSTPTGGKNEKLTAVSPNDPLTLNADSPKNLLCLASLTDPVSMRVSSGCTPVPKFDSSTTSKLKIRM